MSTAVQIQEEVNTLSAYLQRKVLAYVEWLKYRDLVREVAVKSKSLGGIETLTEEDNYQLFEQDAQGASIENITEKTAIASCLAHAIFKHVELIERFPLMGRMVPELNLPSIREMVT
jgi:hypothetical protein